MLQPAHNIQVTVRPETIEEGEATDGKRRGKLLWKCVNLLFIFRLLWTNMLPTGGWCAVRCICVAVEGTEAAFWCEYNRESRSRGTLQMRVECFHLFKHLNCCSNNAPKYMCQKIGSRSGDKRPLSK